MSHSQAKRLIRDTYQLDLESPAIPTEDIIQRTTAPTRHITTRHIRIPTHILSTMDMQEDILITMDFTDQL